MMIVYIDSEKVGISEAINTAESVQKLTGEDVLVVPKDIKVFSADKEWLTKYRDTINEYIDSLED